MVETAWEQEFRRLSYETENDKVRKWYNESNVRDYVLDTSSLIQKEDTAPAAVIIRRTHALIRHLKSMQYAPDLAAEEAELKQLAEQTASASDALSHYKKIAALRRRISFKNPLLNFDKILFFKNSLDGTPHMVHVYGEMNECQEDNTGVYILKDAFSDSPTAVNLLNDAVIANGDHQGESLTGERAFTPDLSYDGKRVVFAASPPGSKNRLHIYSVNIDGSDLQQLTFDDFTRPSWMNDKKKNIGDPLLPVDFDPFFLPSGRIGFLSFRRGGSGRCHGGSGSTFTLHSMRDDGSDLIRLSYHETNEWTPSVDNDGKIVYTRWDYIDRDSDVAHHFWICNPDGTDPRSPHGNYPHPLYPSAVYPGDQPFGRNGRKARPWFEWSIRAIPGTSGRYIGIAGAHHGSWVGSLIEINTTIPDDGAQSQLRRISPDIPYLESEKRGGSTSCAATPLPLSKNYYLCSYTDSSGPGYKSRRIEPPVTFGLYLVDAFGNRELIYRDTTINSYEPIPVVSRSKPPTIPQSTSQGEDGDKSLPQATITVLNMYESDFEWPENTEIHYMRIVQIFPKSTQVLNQPYIGYGNESTARASLGIVPVEKDGSVKCEAPVGKTILFQALDENKLAIVGMRSATYVHEGEQLSCVGCHEDKWMATPVVSPIAAGRAPSKLEPEPNNFRPIQFASLIQPILDSKCAPCHAQKDNTPDFSNEFLVDRYPDRKFKTGEEKEFWTVAYENLEPFAHYFHGGGNGSINDTLHGGSRSLPGHVGARGSKLLSHLSPAHHDVNLSDEEVHRITLWLDLNSEYYGAYYNCEQQARGEFVRPRLDFTTVPVSTTNPNADHQTERFDNKIPRVTVSNTGGGFSISGIPQGAIIRILTLDGRQIGGSRTVQKKNRIISGNLPARGLYLMDISWGFSEKMVLKRPLVW